MNPWFVILFFKLQKFLMFDRSFGKETPTPIILYGTAAAAEGGKKEEEEGYPCSSLITNFKRLSSGNQ